MPLALLAKLLRVLQERVVERLGGNAAVSVDCRVRAASKANLAELLRLPKTRLYDKLARHGIVADA